MARRSSSLSDELGFGICLLQPQKQEDARSDNNNEIDFIRQTAISECLEYRSGQQSNS